MEANLLTDASVHDGDGVAVGDAHDLASEVGPEGG